MSLSLHNRMPPPPMSCMAGAAIQPFLTHSCSVTRCLPISRRPALWCRRTTPCSHKKLICLFPCSASAYRRVQPQIRESARSESGARRNAQDFQKSLRLVLAQTCAAPCPRSGSTARPIQPVNSAVHASAARLARGVARQRVLASTPCFIRIGMSAFVAT
jgi:hypothetical protein